MDEEQLKSTSLFFDGLKMNQTLLRHVAIGSLKKTTPEIRSGMTVIVSQKIKEGEKERIQKFEGLVIATNGGKGVNGTFTVRKVVKGLGVEKIFPLHGRTVMKIEIVKQAKLRRSKLYYVRGLQGKAARMQEEHIRKVVHDTEAEIKAEEAQKKAEEEAKVAEKAQESQAEEEKNSTEEVVVTAKDEKKVVEEISQIQADEDKVEEKSIEENKKKEEKEKESIEAKTTEIINNENKPEESSKVEETSKETEKTE